MVEQGRGGVVGGREGGGRRRMGLEEVSVDNATVCERGEWNLAGTTEGVEGVGKQEGASSGGEGPVEGVDGGKEGVDKRRSEGLGSIGGKYGGSNRSSRMIRVTVGK